MNASDLLAELQRCGVEPQVEGMQLRLRPADAVPPELVATLRKHKTELLAMLSADADKTQLASRQRGLCQQQPQPETHADREIRRFLEVCKPWPDGRGWYDPGACWLPGVREYFEYLKRGTQHG